MTGKKNDSPPLTKTQREALMTELAHHEEAALRLEVEGNLNTYHHQAAARIREELNIVEDDNGKLDE